MNDNLDDRVVLVTGASSGIGRATALALCARRSEGRGGRATTGATRLAGRRSARRGWSRWNSTSPTPSPSTGRSPTTVDRFGRLDALVNNAGLMQSGMILGADTREWVRMVETNLLGSMYAVHAALPHLIETRGAIVQVSSTSGRIASLGSGVYAATKFGISAFTESLRQEVTGRGVRVTLIEPGFVATELTSHITDPVDAGDRGGDRQSMRTLAAEDIAQAVVYALSQPDHVAVNEILIRPTDQVR